MKNVIVTDRELNAGEVVKELRNEKGLTLRQLAAKSETSKSAISRWESGGRAPKLDAYIRVLKALDAELIVTREANNA